MNYNDCKSAWANLDEKEIAAIEEMAAHGFSISQICDVIAGDPTSKKVLWRSLKNDSCEAYFAFTKGYLKSELELRQRIFKDAKNGSSPA